MARELPGPIVLDALNDASMMAGIRNSRAKTHIFRHNDLADLARLLERAPADRPKFVCLESVYSMDGDVGPIGERCDAAERYGAMTYHPWGQRTQRPGHPVGDRRRHEPVCHAAHLRSCAGLCPRNDESAGKRRSTRLRTGAPWLKATLVQ